MYMYNMYNMYNISLTHIKIRVILVLNKNQSSTIHFFSHTVYMHVKA